MREAKEILRSEHNRYVSVCCTCASLYSTTQLDGFNYK